MAGLVDFLSSMGMFNVVIPFFLFFLGVLAVGILELKKKRTLGIILMCVSFPVAFFIMAFLRLASIIGPAFSNILMVILLLVLYGYSVFLIVKK